MRRRDIRLDSPVHALAVARSVAGHRHHSCRRTSGRWTGGRRVTATTQRIRTHQQLVECATGIEVDTKLAIAARGDDVRQRYDIAILVEAPASDRHTVPVITG